MKAKELRKLVLDKRRREYRKIILSIYQEIKKDIKQKAVLGEYFYGRIFWKDGYGLCVYIAFRLFRAKYPDFEWKEEVDSQGMTVITISWE